MKNTDIAMIILVASISVVVSYFLGNAILGDPNDRVENISYMNKIDSNIQQPDVETFNSHALNPTVEVYVGNCGPLEEWIEAEHICKPKEGLGSDETEKEDESNEESATSSTESSTGDSSEDETTGTSSEDSTSGDE